MCITEQITNETLWNFNTLNSLDTIFYSLFRTVDCGSLTRKLPLVKTKRTNLKQIVL